MGKGKSAFTFYSLCIYSVFLMRKASITCMFSIHLLFHLNVNRPPRPGDPKPPPPHPLLSLVEDDI